uniref:Uncharacterized protein n=1 Tax=Globisporangium ultimum (strain ATCC 200006 / CBS 805.95 / DAOM BR144) TaxID=431595 RepID=K3X555_GLOUD
VEGLKLRDHARVVEVVAAAERRGAARVGAHARGVIGVKAHAAQIALVSSSMVWSFSPESVEVVDTNEPTEQRAVISCSSSRLLRTSAKRRSPWIKFINSVARSFTSTEQPWLPRFSSDAMSTFMHLISFSRRLVITLGLQLPKSAFFGKYFFTKLCSHLHSALHAWPYASALSSRTYSVWQWYVDAVISSAVLSSHASAAGTAGTPAPTTRARLGTEEEEEAVDAMDAAELL